MDNSPLLKLPPELRLLIIEFVCPWPAEAVHLNDIHTHTALLRTCHQLRDEAKSTFHVKNIISVALRFDRLSPQDRKKEAAAGPYCLAEIRQVQNAIRRGKLQGLRVVDCWFPMGPGILQHWSTKQVYTSRVTCQIFATCSRRALLEDSEKGAVLHSYQGKIRKTWLQSD